MLSRPRLLPSAARLTKFALLLLVLAAGCSHEPTPPTFNVSKISPDTLCDRIDAVVDHTLHNRTLNTRDHNAWQIVHGILPYGKAFKIENDGQLVPALDWILSGNKLKGWDLNSTGRGVHAELAPGSKEAQGHPDQWIGYLSQGGLDGIHGLPSDEPVTVAGKQYPLDELLTDAEANVYPGMESSWTIMALAAYRPSDYKWTSKDGREWTVEKLVEMDAGLPIIGEGTSCGGTHRLFGLTVAVNRYLKESGKKPSELTGGWKVANDTIEDCIRKTRAFQQPDGSFSTNFFARPGSSRDVDTTLHSTGHTLEWLDVALTDQQLQEPWVTAAVNRLCQLLEDNRDRPLDCGALYHAIRGLRIYRDRRFGPHDLGDAPAIVTAAAGTASRPDSVQAESTPGPALSPNEDTAPAPPAGTMDSNN
jgi:hypothetical protein